MTPAHQNPSSAIIYVWFGLIAIGVLVLGLAMWGATAQISGAVVSSGRLALNEERHLLQLPSGGVVAALHTREGAEVAAGDLLMTLDTEEAQEARAHARVELFQLRARQDRLEAEAEGAETVSFRMEVEDGAARDPRFADIVSGQVALFAAHRDTTAGFKRQLRQRQQQIAAQIKGIDAQITATQTQIRLLDQSLQKHRDLMERGLSPPITVWDMERDMAILEGRAGELHALRAEAAERISEIGLQRVQQKAEARGKAIEKARTLDMPIREFAAKLQRLDAEIAAAKIRAPVSGTVFGLTVRAPRAVLRPAEPFGSVVPRAQAGIVTLHVSPSDIDLVALGQEVKLRLSALNQRLTPEIFAQVSRIGVDTVEDPKTGHRYYEVEAALPKDALRDLPQGTVLLPGMPVQAFVQTGTRTPLAYIAKPLTDYFTRAFREG